MLKQLVAGAGLTLLVLTPAMGQGASTESTAQTPATGDFLQGETSNQLLASNFIDAEVREPNNQKIGSINDLLIDQNGNVQGAIVGVGGFLGIGEKNVGIPFNKIKVVRTANGKNIDHVEVPYTRQQLTNAPNFQFPARNR